MGKFLPGYCSYDAHFRTIPYNKKFINGLSKVYSTDTLG